MKQKINIKTVISSGFPINYFNELVSRYKDINFIKCSDNKNSILNKISNIDVLVNCPRHIFTDELILKAKNLRWIHHGGAGIEEFMTPALKKSNILFTNGKIIQGPEVADHAIGLILSITRNIGLYNKKSLTLPRPIELRNKNCLVFGSGGIGMGILERLNSFGCNNYVTSNDLPPLTSFIKKFINLNDVNKSLKNMDIIICAAPSTFRTKNYFNSDFFKKLKNDCIFINVSRGSLVNTEDLIKYLNLKKFRGVGLDVVNPEPLPKNHSLHSFDNVIYTPHIAGASDHNRKRSFDLLSDNIYRFKNKLKLYNIVDMTEEY